MISATAFQLSVALVMWAAVNGSGLTSMSLSLTESSCETLPSAIHISKEENDETGRPVRTCEGDVTVSKCEGTCTSQLQPSVITTSGFIKDCQCCRESTLREREVALIKCYDPDGQILTGDTGRMTVRLREPSQCKCYKCGE